MFNGWPIFEIWRMDETYPSYKKAKLTCASTIIIIFIFYDPSLELKGGGGENVSSVLR